MIDCKDCTFIIPVKIDCKERLENLWIVLYFLTTNFDTNILVSEQNNTISKNICSSFSNVAFLEFKSSYDLIHRTKQLNDMLAVVDTPIVVNYDCDVLFEVEQYLETIHILRENKADISWPFDKFVWEFPRELINDVLQYGVKSIAEGKMRSVSEHMVAKGGAIFFKTEVYKKGGGENEYFISYAPEDKERYYRFETLGYIYHRAKGHLYHIKHPRHIDSIETHPFFKKNWDEWERIQKMKPEELYSEVRKWDWYKGLNK